MHEWLYTFSINNSRITDPRATSSLSASRLPWCAAQSVGVIPSSSGAFRSLRVASLSRCRCPSRAARWYLSFMAASEPLPRLTDGHLACVCVCVCWRDFTCASGVSTRATAFTLERLLWETSGKATPTSSKRTPVLTHS